MKQLRGFNFKTILFIISGAVLIAISGQLPLSLPLISTDIPGTWQTFAVLTFAFLTNRWIGFFAVLLYLLAGAVGLPVFAEGKGGFDILIGKTGGYLYGFALAAFVLGYLAEKEWNTYLLKSLLAMLVGTMMILLIGSIHLGTFIGFENAFKYGVLPFLLGAAIKIVLGALVAYFIKKVKLH